MGVRLPSIDEAFGVAYVEAMAGGCPRSAARGEAGPEEIARRGGGMRLVPPGDPRRSPRELEGAAGGPASPRARRRARATGRGAFTGSVRPRDGRRLRGRAAVSAARSCFVTNHAPPVPRRRVRGAARARGVVFALFGGARITATAAGHDDAARSLPPRRASARSTAGRVRPLPRRHRRLSGRSRCPAAFPARAPRGIRSSCGARFGATRAPPPTRSPTSRCCATSTGARRRRRLRAPRHRLRGRLARPWWPVAPQAGRHLLLVDPGRRRPTAPVHRCCSPAGARPRRASTCWSRPGRAALAGPSPEGRRGRHRGRPRGGPQPLRRGPRSGHTSLSTRDFLEPWGLVVNERCTRTSRDRHRRRGAAAGGLVRHERTVSSCGAGPPRRPGRRPAHPDDPLNCARGWAPTRA